MKSLVIILALLIPQISWAQFPLNGEGFKASRSLQLIGGEKYATDYDHDVIFYFHDGYVFTSGLKNSLLSGLSLFKFVESPDWWSDASTARGTQPGYTGWAWNRDHCLGTFSILYDHEISEDLGQYAIIIRYDDTSFLFYCDYTEKRPVGFREEPLSPTNLIEEGKKYRNDPDYTDEELIEFFNNFGNGKLILESIKMDFYSGEMEF